MGDSGNVPVTADQQKMNAAGPEAAKKIPGAIVKEKPPSTFAHNIKMITQNGKRTLAGPVRKEERKSSVEAKATVFAGDGNVTNQLTVVPPKSSLMRPV